jgi:hypothetical protein
MVEFLMKVSGTLLLSGLPLALISMLANALLFDFRTSHMSHKTMIGGLCMSTVSVAIFLMVGICEIWTR